VALEVRRLLDQLGLHSFPKTSGWAGVHVYVPVDATHRYEDTKAFARAVAAVLARQRPDRVVDRMALDLRAGKVFVDWSQNDPGKSMVAPYSLRGRPVPVVSTPVTWEEVDATVERRDETQLIFGPGEVLDRLGQHGDRFEGVLSRPQRIPVDLSA
jgi:bifunctional non-homologous end joining protein LigD